MHAEVLAIGQRGRLPAGHRGLGEHPLRVHGCDLQDPELLVRGDVAEIAGDGTGAGLVASRQQAMPRAGQGVQALDRLQGPQQVLLDRRGGGAGAVADLLGQLPLDPGEIGVDAEKAETAQQQPGDDELQAAPVATGLAGRDGAGLVVWLWNGTSPPARPAGCRASCRARDRSGPWAA
jgi:hypothetical protein